MNLESSQLISNNLNKDPFSSLPIKFAIKNLFPWAEIQCLAVSDKFRRRGVGRTLVSMCVGRAREQKVVELMAISNSDKMFQACGFDYSLPNQKRAFFIQPLAGGG